MMRQLKMLRVSSTPLLFMILLSGQALACMASDNTLVVYESTSPLIITRAQPILPPDVSLNIFATGLDSPVDISHANDTRLFVVEKKGRIKVILSDGTVLGTPFLDIRDQVNTRSEQGLLGLAFHPDYANNGYFYVNYTNRKINDNGDTIIARYSVMANNPNQADPASEFILLTVEQDFSNHNGGDLAFGPDGFLYIGLGDGGSGNDPNNRAQSPDSLLGKMLRIDVDGGTPYAIPADNPFVGDANVRDEIWAFGLRNPWRFSFDRWTGDLYIADVGQNAWEEINHQLANSTGGENYGWKCYESNVEGEEYDPDNCQPPENYVFPIHAYSHHEGCSVTGGYIYRGIPFPILQGHYLFADYCSRTLWSLFQDDQQRWQRMALGQVPDRPTTFGENASGEIFVAGFDDGEIYHIVENTPLDLPFNVFLPITLK